MFPAYDFFNGIIVRSLSTKKIIAVISHNNCEDRSFMLSTKKNPIKILV